MARTRPIDRQVERLFGVADLQALALTDIKGKGASAWGHLISTGHYVNPVYGEFDLTLADLDTIVQNFTHVTPQQKELPVDYSHKSRDPQTIDQAKAAGWLKKVEVRNRDDARAFGELWGFTEFTPACTEMIRNKELRYYSAEWRPHFIHKNSGEDIGPALVSAAVTIRPFVEGLKAITLTDAAPKAANEVPQLRGAVRLGDVTAVLDPEDSLDDIREDLQKQVYDRFGYSVWIRDIFLPEDGGCVVIERDDKLFRIEWTLDESTDVPVLGNVLTPIQQAYIPADTALSEDDPMSKTITVTLSDGRKVTVPEDQVISLVDTSTRRPTTAAAAQPSAEVVALTDNVTKLTDIVGKLLTRDQEREKAVGEREARATVDQLVKDGKLLKKQAAWAVNYAFTDPKGFKEYSDTLIVIPGVNATQRGTGEDTTRAAQVHTQRDAISGESISATDSDATQTGAEAEYAAKVDKYIADHKLNPRNRDHYQSAMRAIAATDPDLVVRRRAEMQNTVIPMSGGGVNRHTEVA